MLGTSAEKITRLAGWLARHPDHIGRYLGTSKRTSLSLGVPWFSWPAIDYLADRIRQDMSVFEYGSGGSTLFFAARAARVTAVEDIRDWHAILSRKLEEKGIENVNYLYGSSQHVGLESYANTDYVTALDQPYDCIVVDGTEGLPNESLRPVCFARAERFVAPGGMIVVDDAWRYDDPPLPNRAKKIVRLEGIGPGRPGVTRTDIYHY